MFYFTGLTHVTSLDSNAFLPGAIADHLASTGGELFGNAQGARELKLDKIPPAYYRFERRAELEPAR